MKLRARLAAMIEPLPDGASVLLPVEVVRAWLADGAASSERDLSDLRVEDVAEELGRGLSTVRGWLIAGELAGYKLMGREWRIPRDALRAFLDRQAGRDGREGPRAGGRRAARLSDWRREDAA